MQSEVHLPAATAGGNHLTTEVGGAKRETYSRHRRHHARTRSLARHAATSDRTHLRPSTMKQAGGRERAARAPGKQPFSGTSEGGNCQCNHTGAARGEKPRHERKAQQLVSNM